MHRSRELVYVGTEEQVSHYSLKNDDSLVITLFEGINIKNELINTTVSTRVDDYGTGILAELERLTTTVQKFLGTELKGRMMDPPLTK